eukprot:jgi/Picre1/30006/NNA_005382.t1
MIALVTFILTYWMISTERSRTKKVDALVKQYESCPDNSPEQKAVEQDLGRLFELRTKALTDMAAKQPGLVLKHLVDGWLGEVLGDGTLGDNPMTSASPALRALIQGMNLTSEQMSEFCCIWKQFALAWSKRVPKDLEKMHLKIARQSQYTGSVSWSEHVD